MKQWPGRLVGGVAAVALLMAGPAPVWAASFTGLGDLAGGTFYSEVYDVSADGSTVVGWSESTPGRQAFRWTSSGGLVGLGDLPGGPFESYGWGASADGSVVVGYGLDALARGVAFRWTSATGMVELGDLPGGGFSSLAHDVSADGSVAVGTSLVGLRLGGVPVDERGGNGGAGRPAGRDLLQ